MMKMVFHFARVVDSDITVEGASPGECYQKAIDERNEQFKSVCFPTTGGKEVVGESTLVSPGKLNV